MACIAETWLIDTVPIRVIAIKGYIFERTYRQSVLGGGACCYVRQGMPYHVWSNLRETDIESLWLTLRPSKMPSAFPMLTMHDWRHLSTTQRPHKEQPMISHILQCMGHISQKHPQSGVIVTGDFNHKKNNLLKSYPLSQLITQPTHSTSLLDSIYTNLAQYYNCGIRIWAVSPRCSSVHAHHRTTHSHTKTSITKRDKRTPAKSASWRHSACSVRSMGSTLCCRHVPAAVCHLPQYRHRSHGHAYAHEDHHKARV